MATIRQNQEPPRPFYCHHCSHQWLKAHNSLFECPRCREGFIEEVNEDFNPNVMFPAPPSIDLFVAALNDRSRGNRGRNRNRVESGRAASRSRSPHISNIVIGTSNRQQNGNELQVLFGRRHNAASRFLSVAIDDIMSLIFTSERRQGLTQEQLEAIPLATITNEQVQAELQCAVCFEVFQENENEVRKLMCNHFFHEKCIFPWLRSNPSCPVCRNSLSANQSDSEDDDSSSVVHILSDSSPEPYPAPPLRLAEMESMQTAHTESSSQSSIDLGISRRNAASAASLSIGSPISSRTRSQSRTRGNFVTNGSTHGFRVRSRRGANTTRENGRVAPYSRLRPVQVSSPIASRTRNRSRSREANIQNSNGRPMGRLIVRHSPRINNNNENPVDHSQPVERQSRERSIYQLLVNRPPPFRDPAYDGLLSSERSPSLLNYSFSSRDSSFSSDSSNEL